MIMSDDGIFSTDRHRFELITKYGNEKQRKNSTRNAEKGRERCAVGEKERKLLGAQWRRSLVGNNTHSRSLGIIKKFKWQERFDDGIITHSIKRRIISSIFKSIGGVLD